MKLGAWAVKNSCTRQCTNQLLEILRDEGHELPKDSRTLLNTKSAIPSLMKCGGEYIYFGIEKGIKKKVRSYGFLGSCIYLKVNIDGIPLFKSSSTVFWPILASFSDHEPFLIALFCGASKPSSLDDYMDDF